MIDLEFAARDLAPRHPISRPVSCGARAPTSSGLAPLLGPRPRSRAPGDQIPRREFEINHLGGTCPRDTIRMVRSEIVLMEENGRLVAVTSEPGASMSQAELLDLIDEERVWPHRS